MLTHLKRSAPLPLNSPAPFYRMTNAASQLFRRAFAVVNCSQEVSNLFSSRARGWRKTRRRRKNIKKKEKKKEEGVWEGTGSWSRGVLQLNFSTSLGCRWWEALVFTRTQPGRRLYSPCLRLCWQSQPCPKELKSLFHKRSCRRTDGGGGSRSASLLAEGLWLGVQHHRTCRVSLRLHTLTQMFCPGLKKEKPVSAWDGHVCAACWAGSPSKKGVGVASYSSTAAAGGCFSKKNLGSKGWTRRSTLTSVGDVMCMQGKHLKI